MSFITKRERVFDDYALFDLPARNEGKIKAYASCTDARAWSHFCSDKSEHLVDIIKRNNDSCRPKYVPTEAIVATLMVGKNAEIARLQRKIDEFEQMIAAYDELDLTCEQKCEIAKAHAAIKEANNRLDEMWLNLDLSGFTEGIDSEAFETGKSRGDEPSRLPEVEKDEETPRSKGDEWTFDKVSPRNDNSTRKDHSNQAGTALYCPCDASTIATDPRIQEMQETIITKDAKLNAMKNSMAVLENDVCEPYCIYAHIFTALEKILGVLCQNEKYKLYLEMMTSGKDTRCIDIKGKILFKLKVLEKFSLALIAPCSQDFHKEPSAHECSCYRAEIIRVETAYALTSAESQKPTLDNKRAQLVADIMENEEMKEILSKENANLKKELEIEDFEIDYNIDSVNLKRLKDLQENYDDLMTCYEALKQEKECLIMKCRKYEELEKEFEGLKCQLREYNTLWNEKEHYRKRSINLDTLKEQYLILSDETSNLEVQIKAESEINDVKTRTIDDLRRDNLLLEQKLTEASMLFEKEKNYFQCILKECDCKAMCQDQQIKSLSIQVDRLLEQDPEKVQLKESDRATIALIDEINSQKEQVKNLKDLICCKDEEDQQMQEKLQANLYLINKFKMQIEDLKSAHHDALQRNEYLEQYTKDYRELVQSNEILTQDIEEKSKGLDNLMNVLKKKSEEVNRLMNDMEKQSKENIELHKQIQIYNKSFSALDNEKTQVIKSLQLARQESQELLEKVKDYDDMVHMQDDLATSFQSQNEEYEHLQSLYSRTEEENKNLKISLSSRDSSNSIYLQEIQRLREANENAVSNMSILQDEKKKYKLRVELSRNESKSLQEKLNKFEDLSDQLQQLKSSHERLLGQKIKLENDLHNKTVELDDALHSIQLRRQESEELLHGSENLKTDISQLKEDYARIIEEKKILQEELVKKNNDIDLIFQSLESFKSQNEKKYQEMEQLKHDLETIKKEYDNLIGEKTILQTDFDSKTDEINYLHNTLKTKIEENSELNQRLKSLEHHHKTVASNVNTLLEDNICSKTNLATLKKESDELMQRVKRYENIESEYDKLKIEHDQIQREKSDLEKQLDVQVNDLRRIERENYDLNSQSQHLLSHSEDLEKALIHARTELIVKSSFPENPHADIIKEIEQMKQEKLLQHKKISNLLEKLEYAENEIMNLGEDVSTRDGKIAILENHINELQDEVGRLHDRLNEAVDTGEQITDYSSRRISETIDTMEAHHSRATHNMKMELIKLQSENTRLEDRLSVTKLKSDENARDKHKYISQILHLQNEKEIIVADIKQLEMKTVGDSELSPNRCDVENVVAALERIENYFDARFSKSTSLEQTLLSVQNSYQLVQTKTDEAKKIVEKEKQKILNEKEEAIKDKVAMEKQLIDLKKQLEQDKVIIKDLEAEILNQKLIFDKILDSRQSYISKLEEDMNNLETLYQDSLKKTTELEHKLKITSEEKTFENDQLKEILKKTTKDFEDKHKEIELLNQTLAELKKEPGQTIGIQTSFLNTNSNLKSLTEIHYKDPDNTDLKQKIEGPRIDEISLALANKIQTRERKSIPNNKTQPLNEVQILTANVDSSFDHVRSSYLKYKLKQLSTGRLEHFSISSENFDSKNDVFSETEENLSKNELQSGKSNDIDLKTKNFNVIDIYNKRSMHTDSSKVIDNDDTENDDANHRVNEIESPNKSSAFTEFGLTNESFATGSNIHNELKNCNLFGSTSQVSTDKDLFVIYRDSESNQGTKSPWAANGHSEVVVEAVSVSQNKIQSKYKKKQRADLKHDRKYKTESEPFINAEDDDYEEDDSVKHKLKISLPRVEHDSISIDASDGEKKSLDSYSIAIYSTPKVHSSSDYKADKNTKYQDNYYRTPSTHSTSYDKRRYKDERKEDSKTQHNIESISNDNNQTKFDPMFHSTINSNENESHHKLSRVDAEVLLIKREATKIPEFIDSNQIRREKKPKDFGLDYILDSHNDPNNIKTYDAAKALRKTKSDERYNLAKQPDISDSSRSRLSELKKSSTDHKTISSKSYSKSSNKSQKKSNEIKLDTVDEYENKIQCLTKTLENIEKDYNKKIEAIKMQYDGHIRSILNKHDQGVESIQSLHEETLQDIIKIHENEVENLRSMSIEAMRKADKLEKENRTLKSKIQDCSSTCLDEEPIKMASPELIRRKRARVDPKLLTKTNVEAFNVKPRSKSHGPCTCSLDINVSDTIRNIFEQVDVEQRKIAEYTYLKYIANKILNGNVEALDTQELSFLHLKVCRIWKTKLTKEESLQKRIDSLEAELMSKQKNAQLNIAELDRKVAEERRRLQEVREAVCRNTPTLPRCDNSAYVSLKPNTAEKEFLGCSCSPSARLELGERRSAGDLHPMKATTGTLRPKRPRNETSRAVLAKLDAEERREKKMYTDELPTRLRRAHDRHPLRKK